MPNTKSAKKRHKQSTARRLQNRATKSTIKTEIRKVREAIAAGNMSGAETQFRVAVKQLDQAAASRVIHHNMAARLKSRLSAALRQAKLAKA